MAFPADYTLLRKIPINTAAVTGSNSGFSGVITEAAFKLSKAFIFANTDNGGGDVRLSTDADGLNQIPIEVLRWNKSQETCVLWYLSDGIDDTSPVDIYLWGDNTGDTQPISTAAFGRNAVWPSFGLVCHFEEGSSGSYVDSSGNQPDGAIFLGSISSQEGALGTEIIFNGGAAVSWNVTGDLESQTDFLLSVLCSPADNLANQLCGNFNGDPGSSTNDVRIDAAGAESGNPRFTTTHQVGANSSAQVGSSWVAGDNIWYNYKYEGAVESKILMDGTLRNTTIQSSSMGGGTADFILGSKSGSSDRYVGTVAELRLSNTLPSDDYIATEHSNQSDISGFYLEPEVPSSGVSITDTQSNSNSLSNIDSVLLNGHIDILDGTVNSSSASNSDSVQFISSVIIADSVNNVLSESNADSVILTGAFNVLDGNDNSSAISNDDIVLFSSAIIVNDGLTNSNSVSALDGVFLVGLIDVFDGVNNSKSLSTDDSIVFAGAVSINDGSNNTQASSLFDSIQIGEFSFDVNVKTNINGIYLSRNINAVYYSTNING